MKKRLNKIPTNYTVALTPQEVTNLSETLSAVRTAGGGTGGVYIGDGQYIGVDNTNNRISFLPDAATKLESVSNKLDESTYAADSATFLTAHQSLSGYYQKTETSSKEQLSTEFEKYQTVAGMAEYLTTSNAQTTYLTKSSAEENLAPISVTADVEVLKANSGDFSQYYKKTDTSSKEELSAEFDKYQTKEDMVNYATEQELANTITYLDTSIALKQNKLTFGYNENNAISSINDSALAGQGGKTYSAGAGIDIVDEYISLSADYIQAITQVSGKQDKLEFTYDNSGSIIKINNSAIAGGAAGGSVSYTGRNGVEINGNYIELETTAKNAIDSVGGISTDVGTLKTASAGWDKVSEKLDTTAFSTVSGTFLTTIPDTYATKEYANNASANALSEAKTWVGQQGYITQETDWTNTIQEASAKAYNDATANANSLYQTKGDYVKNTDIGLDANNKVTAISGKELIITAHQSLTNYYTKDETSGAAQISAALAALPGGGITEVTHDTTLTGKGNSTQNLGVAWSALSSNTIDYSNSAFNLTNGTSVSSFDQISAAIDDRYSKSSSDERYLRKSLDNTLTGDGTSNKKLGVAWSALSGNTINSALSADSATSALSAEYANSARYSKQLQDASKTIQISDVTALQNWASSNSSTWDSVSAKLTTAQYALDSATFVTSSISTITGTKQYALTTAGWEEVQGGSTVTIDTTNNEIKDGTSAVSAMSYVVNPNNAYWKPQRSCVCTEAEISTMAGYANGQGMLFFVVSGHNQ